MRSKNIRKFALIFCIISPFLIGLNWINKTESLILTFIQFSIFITSLIPEKRAERKFLGKSTGIKSRFRMLRLVSKLSTFIFLYIGKNEIFDAKKLVDRKFTSSYEIIYVNHVSDWSDNYYIIKKYRIFTKDQELESFWNDNYDEVKEYLDKLD